MTTEVAGLIDEARVFAATEIRPFAATFDDEQQIPTGLIRKMADKGYLGASFPAMYNGLALDAVSYGLLTEQIGKACASTRSLLTVHTSLVGEAILRCGTESQRMSWLPEMAAGNKIGAFALTEPGAGSDARSIVTAYRRHKDRYVINGRKKWISFAAIADFFLVIAKNGTDISAFIVEAKLPGVSVVPMTGLLANRAAHLAEIEFNEVEVPEENRLGKEGFGFTYVVNTALDHGRYSIAWAGLALAQEALDAMNAYSIQRRQFGRKIFLHAPVQAIIAEATTGVHAARALCLRAGSMRETKHKDALMETVIAKCFTAKLAMKVTTDAVQVHGGNGCSKEYPVERLFREAKILEIIEGTTQIHQEAIAEFSVRQYGMK